MSNRMDADSLLWNWARWCWAGETVGNMTPYVSWEDDHRPINHDHARIVDALHQQLPHHERMVVIAEYPQKNRLFADMHAKQRTEAAQRWIERVTGVWLTEHEYSLYLGFFKDAVGRKLL
ncbi:hypothetical protein ACMHYO_14250 [Allopusillimonas ginsengisoli]|uniref:hypothetical protein n=1 Tax=Allopusillimonas ginsengisoli TaxID=453575 RepID=UPI0039C0B375